jgi:LacI family transcriptional regulator
VRLHEGGLEVLTTLTFGLYSRGSARVNVVTHWANSMSTPGTRRLNTGRPTLRDVADLAGVSFKTVSRVVNDHPKVTAETRQRVQAAIEEVGYRRNDAARRLRSGLTSHAIGLVIGDAGNPYYSRVVRAVEEVVRQEGYRLITSSTDDKPALERSTVEDLTTRDVEGLLIVPASDDHRYLEAELDLGLPMVFLDRPAAHFEADMVLVDNRGGARLAVEHLISHGHDRIAIVCPSLSIYHVPEERVQGYRETLRAHGIDPDPELERLGALTAPEARDATLQLLNSAAPPTAIFAVNNQVALGVLTGIREAGQRVAVVGFDDFDAADLLGLTVVSHSPTQMGLRAAQMLCARLNGDTGEPRREVLPVELIARGSGEAAP